MGSLGGAKSAVMAGEFSLITVRVPSPWELKASMEAENPTTIWVVDGSPGIMFDMVGP